MLPGIGAWDTAEVQTVPPLLGTMHPTGFPAFVVLGWLANLVLAPFGEPAFRMTLLSGLLAALAGGLAVFVFRRLGAPALLAGAAALGFALTPITWHIGVSADVHALHIALLVAITLGLLRWEAAVRRRPGRSARTRPSPGARTGASSAPPRCSASPSRTTALTLLLVPAVALFVLAVDRGVLRRPRLVLAALGTAVGVAALLYLELPLRAGPFRAPLVYGHPETLQGLLDVVFARQFSGDLVGRRPRVQARRVRRPRRQTSSGRSRCWRCPRSSSRRSATRATRCTRGVAALLTCLFAALYDNARIDRYYLGPVFFAWSWLAAAAAAIVELAVGPEADPADRAAPRTAGLDSTRTAVAIALGIVLLVPTAIGLRDRWNQQDLSQSTAAPEWLDEALAALDQDAVVVSWWSYSTPLWYGTLIEGRRPDITIIDDRTRLDEGLGEAADVIEANLDSRPVYLIRVTDQEIAGPRARYRIEPVGHTR